MHKPQVNLSEKFKLLNSKMPNYFLPEEDMAKTMKKMHNYFDVTNTKEAKSDDTIAKRMEKIIKTTYIIKNQVSSGKGLDRINKIFHS